MRCCPVSYPSLDSTAYPTHYCYTRKHRGIGKASRSRFLAIARRLMKNLSTSGFGGLLRGCTWAPLCTSCEALTTLGARNSYLPGKTWRDRRTSERGEVERGRLPERDRCLCTGKLLRRCGLRSRKFGEERKSGFED